MNGTEVSTINPGEDSSNAPPILFQFARHLGGADNTTNYYSKVLSLGRDIDSHAWDNLELIPRLRGIRPRVIALDGANPSSRPASDDGKSLEGKLKRLQAEANAHSPWLWYLQPGRPSEYAEIDINTPGKDYILHISGDIPHEGGEIFKYLITNKEAINHLLDSYGGTFFGGIPSNLRFSENSDLTKNLKGLFYTSIFLAGLTGGALPEALKYRRISRRGFLRGAGLGVGAVTLATLFKGPIDDLDNKRSIEVVRKLMDGIASAASFEESVEIQRILAESYKRLDVEQTTETMRVQARTAIVKKKTDDALLRLHQQGRTWEDLSPAVVLLGNAHSLEANEIMQSEEGSLMLIRRYGKFILDALQNFNELLGASRIDPLRAAEMDSRQTRRLQEAVIEMLSLTGIERVYDPDSISIREDFKNVGNDIYKPYDLLIQPEDTFVSQNIRNTLTPLLQGNTD